MSEITETLVPQTGTINAEEAPSAEAAPQLEAAPEVEKAPEVAPKDDKFAAKFAALSRKEKSLRETEKQLTAQAQRLKAMQTELDKLQQERGGQELELRKKVKESPLKALQEEFGLTYEQLSEQVLNDGNPTPQQMMQQMRAELESGYKAELAELKKQIADQRAKEENERYDSAENTFKAELKQFIDSDEKYELTKANEAYELAFDVVKEYYEKTGKVLSHEEAANYVEEHLEEEATKILKLKKMQSKFQAQSQPKVAAKPASPTLSNNMSAEQPVKGTRRLSDEESLKEAAKLIRWED